MKVEDFNYDLPEELIAQTPLKDRTSSRLLVLNKNELIKDNADLTKAGVNVANLMIKIRDINNKRKG